MFSLKCFFKNNINNAYLINSTVPYGVRYNLLQKWTVASSSYQQLSTVSVPVEQTEESVRKAKPYHEIPGFKTLPIFGDFLSLAKRKDFDKNALHKFWVNIFRQWGPIFRIRLPFKPLYVGVCKPEDIETLYKLTMANPIRDSFRAIKKVRYKTDGNYFEKKAGILAEDNEEWWRVRKRVQTPMMKPKNVIRYLPQMDEIALNFMDRIASFQSKFGEMPEDFQNELYKWALESVSLVALDRRLGCLDSNLKENSMQIRLIKAVNNLFDSVNDAEVGLHIWEFFPTPTFRKLTAAHNVFLGIADSAIRETEKSLEAKMKENQDGEVTLMESLLQQEGLSRRDVVTLILDMLFAGIDTTSHTVAFTLYCLAKNPKAQRKLQQELDTVLGTGKDTITKAQIAKLSYLKLCIKETMRMFPLVIGTVRSLERDTVIRGYVIPKKTMVLALNMVTSWDAENFERVDEFLPERWSRDQPYGKIHPFASLPFSHGTRMCIGRRIAEQEMYTFIARALHRFNVEYHYGDMGLKTCLVSIPSLPLKFKFIERNKNI